MLRINERKSKSKKTNKAHTHTHIEQTQIKSINLFVAWRSVRIVILTADAFNASEVIKC